MKIVRKLTAGLLVLILFAVFASEGKIESYAIVHEVAQIPEREIYKSGDSVRITKTYKLLEVPASGESDYGSGSAISTNNEPTWERREYSYQFFYNYMGFDCEVIDSSESMGIKTSEGYYEVTLPQIKCYNSETREYEIQDVYWQVDRIEDDDYYSIYNVYFSQVEYTAPTMKMNCDADEVSPGKSAECKLSIEYVEPINRLNFEIDADVFKVSNEKTLNDWKVTKNILNPNKYTLTLNDNTGVTGVNNPKNKNVKASLLSNTKKVSTQLLANGMVKEIFTFTLKAPDNATKTTSLDNVVVKSIQYSDSKGNGNLPPQTATLNITGKSADSSKEEVKSNDEKKETKTESNDTKESTEIKKEEEKNPVTFDSVISYIAVLIFSAFGIAYVAKRIKKNAKE